MRKIQNLDNFFDELVFEEQIIFAFIYDPKQAAFIFIVDEPNISNPQHERNFLKLSFLNVQNYHRENGKSKIDDIENIYIKEKGNATIDVRELTVGYEELTHKKSFFLYMGISYGVISFYFNELYVDRLETYLKKKEDDYIYINKETNHQINFYNPFNLNIINS